MTVWISHRLPPRRCETNASFSARYSGVMIATRGRGEYGREGGRASRVEGIESIENGECSCSCSEDGIAETGRPVPIPPSGLRPTNLISSLHARTGMRHA